MPLLAIHDKLEDVPEPYRPLYTEKGGKYELTGITGVKTQADVDRIYTALGKERDEHKLTKEKLAVWGDLKYDEVQSSLDKIPELETAAQGKLDDAKIEEIVTRRVDGTLKSRTAPLERQVTTLTQELVNSKTLLDGLQVEKKVRIIHDDVRQQLVKAGIIPEAHEDALLLADRMFEVRQDDGVVVTKDQVGVTPGVGADVWLVEMQQRRPHWWPASRGGGGKGGGAGYNNEGNPFTYSNWNLTKQGAIIREQDGMSKAEQLARLAGTTVGGARPEKPAA